MSFGRKKQKIEKRGRGHIDEEKRNIDEKQEIHGKKKLERNDTSVVLKSITS